MRQKLGQGVTTSLGTFTAQLLEAKSIPSDQVKPLINDILENLPEEYDLERLEEKGYLDFKNATEISKVRLVVREGTYF